MFDTTEWVVSLVLGGILVIGTWLAKELLKLRQAERLQIEHERALKQEELLAAERTRLEAEQQRATAEKEKLALLVTVSRTVDLMRFDVGTLQALIKQLFPLFQDNRISLEIVLQFIRVMMTQLSADRNEEVARLQRMIDTVQLDRRADMGQEFNFTVNTGGGMVGQAIGQATGAVSYDGEQSAITSTATLNVADVVKRAAEMAAIGTPESQQASDELFNSLGKDAIEVLIAGMSNAANPITAILEMAGMIIQKVGNKYHLAKEENV